MADRFRRQRHLAHRIEVERTYLAGRALAGGIKGADRLERIAEEVEPQWIAAARNEDVENAAAHGVFADFTDCRHALEAVALQPRCHIVHAHLVARARGEGKALDHILRRNLLQGRIDRHQHDGRMRLLAVSNQGAERCKPARRRVGARRHPVVGKTIPARKREHRNVGGDEAQDLLQIGDALAVRKNVGDGRSGLGSASTSASAPEGTGPTVTSRVAATIFFGSRPASIGLLHLFGEPLEIGAVGGDARKHRRLVTLGHRLFADDPFDEIVVFLGHDDLKLVQLHLGQTGKLGFSELSENEVHLADAPVPGAKQDPAATRIEIGAGA